MNTQRQLVVRSIMQDRMANWLAWLAAFAILAEAVRGLVQ